MTTPLRILWHSNSPWTSSGYGVQTRRTMDILDSLKEEGAPIDEIGLSAYYGLTGGRVESGSRPMYGNPNPMHDPWGNGSVRHWYRDMEANVLITLVDAWILDPQLGLETNWVPYYPVDHEPVPPAVLGHLQSAFRRISMSEYGKRVSAEVGMESTYIPHCFDETTIYPFTDAERRTARNWFGFPQDHYVYGMVANNVGTPARKAFPEVFAAFQKVVDREPKSLLYVHADPRPGAIGLDLAHLAQLFDLKANVLFPEPAAFLTKFGGDEPMNVLYNAIDCLVSPSHGEGFGVPIMEAQAAGTPVIVQDCTAMPELVENGIVIPKGRAWLTMQYAYQWQPEPEDIAVAMLQIRERGKGTGQAKSARDRMIERYSMDVVEESYWRPLVEELAEAIPA